MQNEGRVEEEEHASAPHNIDWLYFGRRTPRHSELLFSWANDKWKGSREMVTSMSHSQPLNTGTHYRHSLLSLCTLTPSDAMKMKRRRAEQLSGPWEANSTWSHKSSHPFSPKPKLTNITALSHREPQPHPHPHPLGGPLPH